MRGALEALGPQRGLTHRAAAQEIVVGIPHTLRDGALVATPQTAFCSRFAERLADVAAPLGYRVWLADENGTSSGARERMASSGVATARRTGREDAVAAALILENYFSARLGVPRLVAPARGLQRLPPEARGADLALAWLGERGRERRGDALPQAPLSQLQPAAPRGGFAPPKPPPPPPRRVPVSLLRREAGAAAGLSRRELWEQMGGL